MIQVWAYLHSTDGIALLLGASATFGFWRGRARERRHQEWLARQRLNSIFGGGLGGRWLHFEGPLSPKKLRQVRNTWRGLGNGSED